MSEATVWGWREGDGLPAWGVTQIRARLGTGARHSSAHVETHVLTPRSWRAAREALA